MAFLVVLLALSTELWAASPWSGVWVLRDSTTKFRKIDSSHTFTVVKFQGKQTGISKSELSPDGKVIKTGNDFAVPGPNGVAGKQVQYWDKQ